MSDLRESATTHTLHILRRAHQGMEQTMKPVPNDALPTTRSRRPPTDSAKALVTSAVLGSEPPPEPPPSKRPSKPRGQQRPTERKETRRNNTWLERPKDAPKEDVGNG